MNEATTKSSVDEENQRNAEAIAVNLANSDANPLSGTKSQKNKNEVNENEPNDNEQHGTKPSDEQYGGKGGENEAANEANRWAREVEGNKFRFPSHWTIVKKHRALPFGNFTHLVFHDGHHEFSWEARGHRKGKITQPREKKPKRRCPRFFGVDYWDISWWSAFTFTLGSLIWVFNGVVVFNAVFENQKTSDTANAVSAFFGGLTFFFGGFFFYWEGLNIENHANFGADIRKETKQFWKNRQQRENDLVDWKWIGWKSGEIGFLASFFQMCGTTVFFISVVVGLVELRGSLSESDIVYLVLNWGSQIVGAFFLLLSSILMTLETQKHWYAIRPTNLAWNVGFWNIIGSVGFLLSGIFGLTVYEYWGTYFSTYWGSFAFLLGSYLQLYEVLNNNE